MRKPRVTPPPVATGRAPMIFRGMNADSLPPIPARERFSHAKTLAGDAHKMALDSALGDAGFFDFIQTYAEASGVTGFLGYPVLQQISQNPMIKAGVETLADEMTRKFVVVRNSGETEEEKDRITEELDADLKKHNVQEIFRDAAAKTGYYGGCLVFIDTGESGADLKNPLILDRTTFKPGSLRRFVVVDPINVYPGLYNTSQPLKGDYFQPKTWYVMGTEVHASRFLYFCADEAPLLLKPSYNFFGIPIAQQAWEFVQHFTQTREAAARLLTKFSLTAFKTNLSGTLNAGGTAEVEKRIHWFIEKQNNDGCFVIDKDSEDLMKLDTQVSGVVDIVRQALELVATVFRMPAVKYLGISPAGFNATGEADMRNWWDYAASQQQKIMGKPMGKVMGLLQMNRYGEINRNIVAEWEPLGDEDERQLADIQKVKADTAAVYLDRGALSPEEVRQALADDPKSGFNSIDADALPEQPEEGGNDDADKAGEIF